jgi:hypothetical protein
MNVTMVFAFVRAAYMALHPTCSMQKRMRVDPNISLVKSIPYTLVGCLEVSQAGRWCSGESNENNLQLS